MVPAAPGFVQYASRLRRYRGSFDRAERLFLGADLRARLPEPTPGGGRSNVIDETLKRRPAADAYRRE
jgi:hypothetical protein